MFGLAVIILRKKNLKNRKKKKRKRKTVNLGLFSTLKSVISFYFKMFLDQSWLTGGPRVHVSTLLIASVTPTTDLLREWGSYTANCKFAVEGVALVISRQLTTSNVMDR